MMLMNNQVRNVNEHSSMSLFYLVAIMVDSSGVPVDVHSVSELLSLNDNERE